MVRLLGDEALHGLRNYDRLKLLMIGKINCCRRKRDNVIMAKEAKMVGRLGRNVMIGVETRHV